MRLETLKAIQAFYEMAKEVHEPLLPFSAPHPQFFHFNTWQELQLNLAAIFVDFKRPNSVTEPVPRLFP